MGSLQRAHFTCSTTGAAAAAATAAFFSTSEEKQLDINGALRFALVQSTRRSAAPFASLSASSSGRHVAANPLFSLSRLTDSGTASGSGSSSDDAAGASSSGGGGYESDSESSYYGSDLGLDKINCQLCRQALSRKPRRGLLGRRRKARGSSQFLVCDCCQRAYHEDCCSTKEAKDGTWYHSSSCKECQEGLQQQASKGPITLPAGRTWQLIDCSPVSSKSGLAGAAALASLKRSLGGVLEVLLPTYGPGVAQQLVDTSKGYAVLLRQQEAPVTAGLLDVYGQECAVLDLVATQMEEQGRGHCSALLAALEGWLGPQLGVASLIAVCPADEPDSIRAWQQKFGFRQLKQQQLRQLMADVPPLNYYEESVLLSKKLPKQQSQKSKQLQQPEQPQQQAPVADQGVVEVP